MMIAPRARLAFYYSCAALLLGLLLTGPVRAQNALSGVLINEILADPNGVNNFDTDGDGTAEASDEFIELFNSSGLAVDISGWEIYDDASAANNPRHTFDGALGSGTVMIPAGGFVAVVSQYDPGSIPSGFFAASSGSLAINNTGDTMYLRDPGTNTFIATSYNGDTPTNTPMGTPSGMFEDFGSDEEGQSIQRRPDGSTTFVTDTPNPAATNGGGAGNAALVLTTVVDRADAVCSDPNDIETCNLSSSSSSVTAAPGEKVVVRYTAENTGDVTLTTHDLVDTEEGVLLSSLSFDLAPGATVFVDNFSMASGALGPDVRMATWTAEDDEGAVADDEDTYEIVVEMAEVACPESLVLSDFAAFAGGNAFELRNTGAEPASLAGCSFVATYNDVYVALDLGDGTVAPGAAVGFTPGEQFRNVFGGLALLDRPEVPAVGTSIMEVQTDIIASLVYLGHDVVYGFYHRDAVSFEAQCDDYAQARLGPFARGQCASLSRSEGDENHEGPVALSHADLTEAMLSVERGATAAEGAVLPTAFALSAAYPNPMAERGTVTVDVPEAADVRVVVYDVLGRAVATLLDEAVEAGRYEVSFDASSLAPGTYLARMTAGAFAQTQRVTVVR